MPLEDKSMNDHGPLCSRPPPATWQAKIDWHLQEFCITLALSFCHQMKTVTNASDNTMNNSKEI